MGTNDPRADSVRMNLGTAIAFRGADVGRRAVDAKESQFLLEVIRHVLGTVIVTQRQYRPSLPSSPGLHPNEEPIV